MHQSDPVHSPAAFQPAPAADLPERRTFLGRLTALLGAAAGLLAGLPVVGYFLGLRPRRTIWVPLGAIEEYPIGETRLAEFDNPLRQPWDGMTAKTGVYVRNDGPSERGEQRFLVLAVNCTHLGCPVSWFPQSGLFMCPCHGGVYYSDGEHASGPPPRGLYHCEWQVRSGKLEVQAPHFPTLQDTLTDNA